MTFKAFDRANIKTLRDLLDEHMSKFAAQHGLHVKLGNFRFTHNTVRLLGIEVSTLDAATGAPQNLDRERYTQVARMYGLDPAWLGKSFKVRGEEFVVSGMRKINRTVKKPVLSMGCDGRTWVWPVEAVRRAFQEQGMTAPISPDQWRV